MAEEANSNNVPAMNDVEMKEEMAESPVLNIPSAQDQVPAGSYLDPATSVLPEQAAAGAQINQAPNAEPAHTAMEGLMNGQATSGTNSASQAQTPPAAQAPSAFPLPATATASLLPNNIQIPASAPTPPLAPPTRPASIPPSVPLPPEKPHLHGSPTRVYLNQAVTPHLLEAMKHLAAHEPEKPLKWLSEFLAKRSAEIEGDS